MKKFYTESFGAIEVKNFNKEKREIYDVVILGKESRNKRSFSDSAMAQAVPMLEGSTSYLNHREDLGTKRSSSHDIRDILGYFEGVYFDGQKVKARVFKVTNSEHATFIFDMVENHNKSIGFSIDWAGEVSKEKDKVVVQSFESIRSADLVAEPATTSNFFESTINDEGEEKEKDMADKTITLESLQKDYPDIVKAIADKAVESLRVELKTVQDKYRKDKIESLQKEKDIEKIPDWAMKVLLSEPDESKLESIMDDFSSLKDKKDDGKDKKKIANPPKKKDSGMESTLEADCKKWLNPMVIR